MSVKVKQAITNCLKKIENQIFDEDTIRTLLIVSREHIKTDGLIKELAHFIAHTERNQGMFHKKINSRYAKFKLVKDQVKKHDVTELRKMIKTEDELSDFMLDAVSVEKIEAKLFNTLYIDGLDDLPESHLLKYTGKSKSEVKKLFDQFYVKKDGFYHITTTKTENYINVLKKLPLSMYNPEKEVEVAEEIQKAEVLIQKTKSQIDAIQRVIRGAIFFNSVFDTKTFQLEIVTTITQVTSEIGIDIKSISYVKDNSDDILLCIMTLLHDSKFTFYDKSVGNVYLCFYLDYNIEDAQNSEYNLSEALYEKGVIALYISGQDTVTFPLFVSDLPIKKYLPYETFKSNPLTSNISKTIWTTASRIEKKLQLINERND